MHVAATLGHFESLQALLFYGADINLQVSTCTSSYVLITDLAMAFNCIVCDENVICTCDVKSSLHFMLLPEVKQSVCLNNL